LLTSRALDSLKLPGLIRLPKLRHDLLAKSTFGT
jgi:hypothetical protein